MASLVLLFSELVRNRKCGASALLAAYPPSSSYSTITSSSYATVRKPLNDEDTVKNMKNRRIEEIQERMTENLLESRVCVDFVWP
ncbi:hypothetical protein TanjilG_00012 [Lupinus angustifolius]|uniref:Uncharacterized protein n=1 Tax=Lupinus angustifolius TaxID=3871 RepID=A0A4P1QSV5_LUPAN|nr:hypothetical protein TanjilG_00012 [Lupinus angustifolius]